MSDETATAIFKQLDKLGELFHKLDKKVGVTNKHIEGQNGKVARNEYDIRENKKTIDGMKLWIATWSGGAAAVGVILQQLL